MKEFVTELRIINMEHLITLEEAARRLSVSKLTLRLWDNDGALPAVKTKGGHRRYRESDIVRFQLSYGQIMRGQNMNKFYEFRASEEQLAYGVTQSVIQIGYGNKELPATLIGYDMLCFMDDRENVVKVESIFKVIGIGSLESHAQFYFFRPKDTFFNDHTYGKVTMALTAATSIEEVSRYHSNFTHQTGSGEDRESKLTYARHEGVVEKIDLPVAKYRCQDYALSGVHAFGANAGYLMRFVACFAR